MGFLYILLSLKDNRTYTGSTPDLNQRLQDHAKGKVRSTRYRRPLKLIYQENFNSLREARERESFFKSASGRRLLKKILADKIPSVAG